MSEILIWWLAVSLLGLLAMPLAFWLLGRLPGRGLLFARPLGILFTTYFLWLGASLGVLRNNLTGILLSICALAGLSVWLSLRSKRTLPDLWQTLRQERRRLLIAELLFGLGFIAWTALRAYAADKIMPSGGEKFMEIAFLNGVLNSPSFPPLDPWLSGFSISYYYFGYVQMGFFTRLTGLPVGVAFELYDAILFALALQLPFALASEMAALSGLGRLRAVFAGLAAALFTAGMGNLQGLFEALYARGWLPAPVSAWLALPDFPPSNVAAGSFYPGHASWWWWRASRVISDLDFSGQRIPANPITEFPFFSFLLGDNHPHVLALPFTLLVAALALDWARRGSFRVEGFSHAIPRLIFSALAIGGLIFLNTWDFPIYLAIVLIAFLAGQYARQGRLLRSDWLEGLQRALFLLIGAGFLYLPFLMSFSSQAGGILPYVFPPTRLGQYLVMFGPFIFILAVFLPSALAHSSRDSVQYFPFRRLGLWWLRLAAALAGLFLVLVGAAVLVLALNQLGGGLVAQTMQSWLGGGTLGDKMLRILAARAADPWLFLLLSLLIVLASTMIAAAPRLGNAAGADIALAADPPAPDLGLLLAALLILAGLVLTFSVEFLYLRDSFGVRMNTVFKFYFQGWVLLACACGYAIAWASRHVRLAIRLPFFLAAGMMIAACLLYPVMAVAARTHEFTTAPNLDGASNLRAANPDDWAAIDWLLAQPRSSGRIPVLLEAPCPAYCYAGRISAFTGFPAVLGWSSHEAQWRNGASEQSRRQKDIATIYTSADPQTILSLLSDWKVEYVILGETEQRYITALCSQSQTTCDPRFTLEQLDQILVPVFKQGTTTIFAPPR
jgi:YYY domain-containing protein